MDQSVSIADAKKAGLDEAAKKFNAEGGELYQKAVPTK